MGTNNRVMLVEDDTTMLSVLKTLLEMEGYQVVTAPEKKQLEEIVQSIHDAKPNILLLDVHLRETNGYEIMQKIRKDAEISRIRVVMSSGMDVRDRCMAVGADDFLLKPYMPDELLEMLQAH